MSAESELETARSAATTAIAAGDWATARVQLLVCKTIIATLPASSTAAGFGVSWSAGELDSLIDRANRELAAADVAANGIRLGRWKPVAQTDP